MSGSFEKAARGRAVQGLALLGLTLTGCGSCDEEAALRVEGPTPYVRCFAREVPDEVEGFEVDAESRTLRAPRYPDPIRLVVMAGRSDLALPAEAIAALDPTLVLVLGSFDADAPVDLSVPILTLPGAGDAGDAATPAGAIDLSPFRRLTLGPAELVPLAGVSEGGYAEAEAPCGFAEADVARFALDPPADGHYRLLLSFVGPPRPPASLGLLDVEAGDPRVAHVAEIAHARGVLFAWPEENALRADANGTPDLALAVPPGAGPWVERADGSRVPSLPTLILLGADGALHSP